MPTSERNHVPLTQTSTVSSTLVDGRVTESSTSRAVTLRAAADGVLARRLRMMTTTAATAMRTTAAAATETAPKNKAADGLPLLLLLLPVVPARARPAASSALDAAR